MANIESKDISQYTCNICQLYAHYHCSRCEDYDLCNACYGKNIHNHPMEKLLAEKKNKVNDSFANTRNELIIKCVASVVHSCQCRDVDCRLSTCQKMKKVIQHTRTCKKRQSSNSGCPVCKQMMALCCYHSKHCNSQNYLVNWFFEKFCERILANKLYFVTCAT